MRLDAALAQRGLCASRTAAQARIAQGRVTVNGLPAQKPSQQVGPQDTLALAGGYDYAGRGGLKLHAGLVGFHLDPAELCVADIGASTGGFTHCLLRFGARRVYAVDVGHDQLAGFLAADPRVVSLTGVNARQLHPGLFDQPLQAAVMDVSFISQTLILPALAGVLPPAAWVITLVKPQFECGRQGLNRHGVVTDPAEHARAVQTVSQCAAACGFRVCGQMPSPITGGDGNREYLLWLQRCSPGQPG